MTRWLFAGLLGLAFAGHSLAHFVFIVPQADEKGVQVVFSDTLAPDSAVDIGKISALKLLVSDAGGKDLDLKPVKAEHALTTAVAGTGSRTLYGSIDYGVLQRGDSKPFMLAYYPKAILGDPLAKSASLGDKVPVEVIPVGKAGAMRFQVIARGKPLAKAEVNLLLPGDKKDKLTTDAEGMTPVVGVSGRLGMWVRFTEAGAGELNGKKYEEVRRYATLVVDMGGK